MEKLLTVKDLSEGLQVSSALVYRWVHSGFVPYIKIGDIVRFNKKKVDMRLKKRENKNRASMKL